MIKKVDRILARVRKHKIMRDKNSVTPERPRITVFRSLTNIFAQLIDDTTGRTLVSASTIEKGNKVE
ncbi:50S ribosomal protein L18, partial [Streptobacillus moniliformis]|uniref:50S ribosomal protein L18 n=1 Tax=Streptobacillus moniliformis TaxID=34105 RepID=UPI000A7AAB41